MLSGELAPTFWRFSQLNLTTPKPPWVPAWLEWAVRLSKDLPHQNRRNQEGRANRDPDNKHNSGPWER